MTDEELVAAATEARTAAYAPYSKFSVGAALLGASGRSFLGCNVENLSYGLTLCAERAALVAAITAGDRHFEKIAIVSDSDVPIVPCGACRQVLAEFNAELTILSATIDGQKTWYSLQDLLPLPHKGILNRLG